MDTTEMTPRELDAALAERLFRWPISQLEAPDGCPDFLEQWVEAHVPRYSTTGDGMLLVLEAMQERGHGFSLYGRPDQSYGCYYTHDKAGAAVFGDADTLSRAVAIAALAALEKEAGS